MSAVQALSSAAVPAAATAAGGGSVAPEAAGKASFSEALRSEVATPTAVPANSAGTATAASAAVAAETNAPSMPESPPGSLVASRPLATPAAAARARALPSAAEAPAVETLPAALPGPGAAAFGETRTLHEGRPGSDAADPLPAAPEAFLQWLDHLKEFAKPFAPASAAPSISGEPVAAASAGLQGASGAAVTQQMIDALAAGSAMEPAATGSSLTVGSTALPTASAPLALVSNTSPPTTATAPLSLAMDQGDWPQQLGEQIQWRLGVGIQEARIEISPRELGAIDVRLSVDDRGLSVQLSAAQAQTRDMLQAELPRLREALQQGGLQLADAQVGHEAPGRQGERQAAPSQTASEVRAGSKEEGEGLSPSAGIWRARRGLLDDYA